jgi:DNA-binding MarR family transcriptional regulator
LTKHKPDSPETRPLALNEKVGRIASSLIGRLSSTTNPLALSEEAVAAELRAWRERGFYLPAELFSDPAWGMLLELLHAEVMQTKVPLLRLCKASAASTPTAVRWLDALECRELVLRKADPDHPRSELIELSPKASAALRQYFHDVLKRY